MENNLNTTSYQNPGGSQRVNIFYFSDYHGNIPAYRRLKTASDSFDRTHQGTENLKLAGGDLVADVDPKKRTLVYRLLKLMKLDASAVGNHEWGHHYNFYKKFDKRFKETPMILFNNFISGNTESPFYRNNEKTGLFHSRIISKNGQKYGLIGATTPEYHFEGAKVHDWEQTIKDLETEILKLKQKEPSLNKIILLSHLGKETDEKTAQSVSGIDIIIGGHSHTLIKGVEQGKNLLISPTGEPVLIVQAGNERGFGELSAVFDNYGRLDMSPGNEPINKTGKIKNYEESREVKKLEEWILGEKVVIGFLKEPIYSHNRLTEENPLGSLASDAILNKTGADVAMMNAGTFRSSLKAGELGIKDIEYCMPFKNNVISVKLSGEAVADIITAGVESLNNEAPNPGLFQVSGIRYTVTPDKKVKNLYTVDGNENKKIEILDNKGNLTGDSTKIFNVAMTDYMIEEYAEKGFIAKEYKDKQYPKYGNQSDILINYIKTEFTDNGKPVEVDKGRITFEESGSKRKNGFAILKNRFKRLS